MICPHCNKSFLTRELFVNKNSLGGLFKHRRESLGLSIVEFAPKIGVCQSHISQIEHHDRIPSLKVLHKISDELKLSKNFRKKVRKYYIDLKYPELKNI